MEYVSYKNFYKRRKSFLAEHSMEDFYYEINGRNLLISCPHGVSQVRLGKHKHEEPGTVGVGLELKDRLDSSIIIKTKNNFDDANFDAESPYREKIKYILSVGDVKYLIDLHGLSKSRECDVNLGINFGENIKNDENLYGKLYDELVRAGFNVTVDDPFRAGEKTISGYFASHYNVWTIQIEINSAITNESGNIKKLNTLIDCLAKIFKNL